MGWVDVVGLPGVVGSWALAAEPAVGCVVSYGFGSGCVVASIVAAFVGSVGVDEGLVFGLAGWAAVAGWGELAAVEAGAADGHETGVEVSVFVLYWSGDKG